MTYKTAVEHYVEGMLRTHTVQSLPRVFVEKALMIIDVKLDNPCCTDPDASYSTITRANSAFVNHIQILVNSIPKAGNVTSLLRTKKLLERRLDCCIPPTTPPPTTPPPTTPVPTTPPPTTLP